MSYIDAMIAQGGGIDLSQITQSAQMAKQNDLLNLQRQNAIEQAPILQQRATTEYDQGQEDRDFQMKVRSAGMYTSLYEAGDIAGALNVFKDTLSKAQQTPESQQQIQKIMAALQTGDPNDDKIVADELYKNAKPVSQWGKQQEGGIERQNVQSTFVGDNGNLFTVRRNGDVVDTGYKPSENVQLVTRPDGSTIAVDTKGTNAGQPVATVVTQEEALQGKENAGRASETGSLTAKIELEPKLKAAVAQAEATATAAADLAKEKKGNDKTFAIYDVGMTKLMESLGNTDTGPFIGRIPAVTTNQQISDAAIAAMAPVMKQMFRAAGEGIFTDKDQELLMKMIPDRKLSPEARASAFQGIDAIVRAKLGMSNSVAPKPVSTGLDELSDEELLRKLNGG